jgi:hypothetical protein
MLYAMLHMYRIAQSWLDRQSLHLKLDSAKYQTWVFGCTAYVTRDKKETDFVKDKKLDPRGAMGCFVGIAEDGETYGVHMKGYMVWSLETGN